MFWHTIWLTLYLRHILTFYLTNIQTFYLTSFLTYIYSDLSLGSLSGILSGILSDILSCILSDILSDISGILSDIQSETIWLPDTLLWDMLIIWHSFQHLSWHSTWFFDLTFYLAFYLVFYFPSISHFLTFSHMFPTFHLAYWCIFFRPRELVDPHRLICLEVEPPHKKKESGMMPQFWGSISEKNPWSDRRRAKWSRLSSRGHKTTNGWQRIPHRTLVVKTRRLSVPCPCRYSWPTRSVALARSWNMGDSTFGWIPNNNKGLLRTCWPPKTTTKEMRTSRTMGVAKSFL